MYTKNYYSFIKSVTNSKESISFSSTLEQEYSILMIKTHYKREMLVKKFVIKKKLQEKIKTFPPVLNSFNVVVQFNIMFVFFLNQKHSTCIQLVMSDGMDLNVKISVDIALQMTVAITSMVAVSLGVIEVTLETFAALVSLFFICP